MEPKKHLYILSVLVLAASLGACQKTSTAAEEKAASVADAGPAKTPSAKLRTAKVVFIGQKNACECTRSRIEKSLAAVQQALAGAAGVTFERIDWDTDPKRAEKYEKMGKLMVIPGIYFLDKEGKYLTHLQGEVTAEKVAEALK
ncbi:MAG: hypothetical protein D6806_12505 [Deltaproteobacteria bacterium]|nr:MAG: hypothetical protein D6806_12505 [Deltaproteobacteria bacterium]